MGELTTCKDEMTNLKEEIKKFNQVMRDQVKSQPKFEWESSPLKMTKTSHNQKSSSKKYHKAERTSPKSRTNFHNGYKKSSSHLHTSKYINQKHSPMAASRPKHVSHHDPKNQVLKNFKEEIDFLRRQNNNLREAVLETQGIALVPFVKTLVYRCFKKMHGEFENRLKKQAMTINNYERRIGAFVKNIAYVRSMNQCENRRRKKELHDIQKKLSDYLARTDELLRENLSLKNENNLGAESLIESEKRINKLKKEVDLLRKNQMTLKQKDGKFLI
jgi:hypothetical protein